MTHPSRSSTTVDSERPVRPVAGLSPGTNPEGDTDALPVALPAVFLYVLYTWEPDRRPRCTGQKDTDGIGTPGSLRS